ncbi:hypothetical protein JCGZ_13583 [Jatropha curcas]|uniref:Uncharacterized protein n=1 Tax=Jatropha curcas TaxID=180498 RepID=A0A067KMQ5_JATCU|nr:hypothetical protein JCGZ_13583 [Jatropha curcas]
MAKLAEVMKRKARAGSLEKEVPLVLIETQPIIAEDALEAIDFELPPLSPTSKPYEKRQREESAPIPPPFLPRLWISEAMFCINIERTAVSKRIGPIETWLATVINANNVNFARTTRLKGGYIRMEVKKNEMEDALKSVKVSMREQEAQHKMDIDA